MKLLTGVGKWITLGLTTSAALVGLIVNTRTLGLSEWLDTAGLSGADRAARRVVVAPTRDTLEAIGDTLPLAATVTDERGLALSGATLIWKSMNQGVASVDSSGAVVAVGPGSTIISVTVRDLTARAVVTVRQRAVAVEIPDTAVRIAEGGARRMEAWVLDAREQRIGNAPLRWTSADTAVATVDSLGTVMGRAPGRTLLAASTGELSDRVAVEVMLTPAVVRVVTGTDQRAAAGRRLAQPVVVEVLSRGGRPIAGLVVSFAPVDEAAVDPAGAMTDARGRARSVWTLGPRPGRQRLLVNVEGLDSSAVLTAEADPLPANTRVEAVSGELEGPAGGAVPDPVVIRVTDTLGTALVDLPLTWTALDRGTVQPLGVRTDSLGEARARWTLGPRAGPQRLRVQVGNARSLPATTVTAAARPGAPTAVAIVSGDKQVGTVSTALRRPVVVQVADAHGNPVPAARVGLTPSAGGVGDGVVTADEAGRVSVTWTLGRTAGAQRVAVRALDGEGTATVSARAAPAAAANIAFRNPPTSGTVGRALPRAISALVTDAYGNPVPEALAVFSVSTGMLSAARVMTSDRGLAATRWTLGARAGEQTLTAVVRGTAARSTLTVQANPVRR